MTRWDGFYVQTTVGVLGPLMVRVAGRETAPRARQLRALLGTLALADGAPVTPEYLLEVVWRQQPGAGSLQVAMHRLRRWLDETTDGAVSVATVPSGYVLRLNEAECDLARFRGLMTLAERLAGADRTAVLEQALALWRGAVLADVPEDQRPERVVCALEAERTEATVACAEAELASGHLDRAVELAQALCADRPLDERSHAVLVAALAAAGRQAEALAVYETVRAALADELGVDPGPELRDTHLRVLRQQVPRPARRRAEPERPCLLPPAVADFTGRGDAVDELVAALSAQGGVVGAISGKPGVGKTALAVQVGHRLRAACPDGQLYADLRGAEPTPRDPTEVQAAFLRALGVPDQLIPADAAERTALYRSRLAGRRLLIVLDNAAGEGQVRPLLPAGGPAVVVTSRARLVGLEGAHQVDLNVFDQADAATLLARIAGAERVAREPAAARRVVEQCGLLPLAVRIAGARLAARPHWPVSRLEHLLDDEHRRLDQLAVADFDVRASFALSYRALPQRTARAFRLLGMVAVDDFPEWLVGALLDTDPDTGDDELERLVEAQLVEVASVDVSGQTRYRFHDLIRLYAQERTHEEEPGAARAALSRAFDGWLGLAALASTRLRGPEPAGAVLPGTPRCSSTVEAVAVGAPLAWFDAELRSLVAVVAQAARCGLAKASWQLAWRMLTYLEIRSFWTEWRSCYHEGLAAARDAGDRSGEAYMLLGLADLAYVSNQHDDAERLPAEALAAADATDDNWARGLAIYQSGCVARSRNNNRRARGLFAAAMELHREVGSVREEALALSAWVSTEPEPHRRAVNVQQQRAVAMLAGLGLDRDAAQVRRKVAIWHQRHGDLETAAELFRQCLDTVDAYGDELGEAYIRRNLGEVLAALGQRADAFTELTAARSLSIQVDDALALAASEYELGRLHLRAGDLDSALAHLVPAAAGFDRLARPLWQGRVAAALGEARERLGDRSAAREQYAAAVEYLLRAGAENEAESVRRRLGSPTAKVSER
jgi:DNA-binding SARP family transcriptional activator